MVYNLGMADITQEHLLTDEWQDITTELSLANSTTYLVDFRITGTLRMSNDVVIQWAKTDNTTAPTIAGHVMRAAVGDVSAMARFTQNASENLWMKMQAGEAYVVATKA